MPVFRSAIRGLRHQRAANRSYTRKVGASPFPPFARPLGNDADFFVFVEQFVDRIYTTQLETTLSVAQDVCPVVTGRLQRSLTVVAPAAPRLGRRLQRVRFGAVQGNVLYVTVDYQAYDFEVASDEPYYNKINDRYEINEKAKTVGIERAVSELNALRAMAQGRVILNVR